VDAGSLARRIRSKGLELGLGGMGFAAFEPSDRAGRLSEWLAAGRAGEMEWMARTAASRIDPRQRFPWARTAVVAAVPYLPYRGDRHAQEGLARISHRRT
jgi:epoxyqueuosine reductase